LGFVVKNCVFILSFFWGCGRKTFIELLLGLSVAIFLFVPHKKPACRQTGISTSIPQLFIGISFFIFYYALWSRGCIHGYSNLTPLGFIIISKSYSLSSSLCSSRFPPPAGEIEGASKTTHPAPHQYLNFQTQILLLFHISFRPQVALTTTWHLQ
jgi:hypothetical protein